MMRQGLRAAAVWVMVLVLGLVAGCSGSGAGGDAEKGELTVWVYPYIDEQAWWAETTAAFTAANPDISVEVVVQPWADRDTQLTTAIAGGSAPDLVFLIPDQVAVYGAQDLLVDVSEVTDTAGYQPAAVRGASFNDTLFGLPIMQSVASTLVYKPAFEAVGITEYPSTWAEVLAAAPKLKAAGYNLTDYYGDSTQTLNLTFYPLLWQAGGDVLSQDGSTCTIDSPAGVSAVEFLKTIFDNGWASTETITAAPGQNTALQQKKVAMMFSYASSTLTQNGLDPSEWESLPPLTGQQQWAYGTVGSLALLASSHQQPAAKTFLKWFAQPEQTGEYAKSRTYFSPLTAQAEMYAADTLQAGEQQQLSQVKTGISSPQARQLMDLIKPHLQSALLGRVEPQAALSAACDEVDRILTA